jgi:hypothetical protein
MAIFYYSLEEGFAGESLNSEKCQVKKEKFTVNRGLVRKEKRSFRSVGPKMLSLAG